MDGWIGDGFFLAWLVCLALIKKMLLGSVARFVLFCWYDGTMSGWMGGRLGNGMRDDG
jgi:hypothetical protein